MSEMTQQELESLFEQVKELDGREAACVILDWMDARNMDINLDGSKVLSSLFAMFEK